MHAVDVIQRSKPLRNLVLKYCRQVPPYAALAWDTERPARYRHLTFMTSHLFPQTTMLL